MLIGTGGGTAFTATTNLQSVTSGTTKFDMTGIANGATATNGPNIAFFAGTANSITARFGVINRDATSRIVLTLANTAHVSF